MKSITPLAVLLLAFCSSSSGEAVFWSFVDMYSFQTMGNESTFIVPYENKSAEHDKFILGNISSNQFHSLNHHLGNTIYAMILNRLGMYEQLPAYYRKALDNGVLCEVNRRLDEYTIRSIQYHSDELTEDQRNSEVEAAKDPAIGIDCTTSRDHCFCGRHNVLLYCAALKFAKNIRKTGVALKQCESDLLDSIERAANKPAAHSIAFYLDDKANELFAQFYNDPRPEWERESRNVWAPRYCSALEPSAAAAVEALFAANALRWTLEGFVLEKLFNRTHKDIDSACNDENFSTSEIGKCACAKDTGISFCAHKVRAQYFKTIGYLVCAENAQHFEQSTRPATIPPFACHASKKAADDAEECSVYRAALKQ